MATITKNNILVDPQWGLPAGNAWVGKFHFETNASGYFVDSNTPATAVGIGDVVRLGVLQAGTELYDSVHIVSDAFTSTSTFTLGFAYVDGVDDTDVPQDADYFGAAVATTAGVTRKVTTTVPVILPKDAYLTLTNNTAAQNVVGVFDMVVFGRWTGVPN